MEKIRFITDSAADLGVTTREDVTIVPMQITIGLDEYYDGVTITHHEFYEKLIESDELPKTSQVTAESWKEAFQKAVDAGEKVVCITLSSKLSATFSGAELAAKDFPNQVFVVDSLNATIGERVLVEYGFQLKDEGKSAEEIANILTKERENVHILALLDTLEYLKKGGRISKTVAFFGEALRIKPVVSVIDGKVEMIGKAKGSKNGNNFLTKEVEKANGVDFSKPHFLGYTGLSDALLQKYLRDSESLWKEHVNQIPIATVGATIGTHVGPNGIVVAFFANK